MASVEDFQRACFTDGGTHREGELVLDISVRRLEPWVQVVDATPLILECCDVLTGSWSYGSQATIPALAYAPTISLLVALSDSPSVPFPGGIQFRDDPTWSWIGDNMAKGVSPAPALTLHTSSEVATARWEQDDDALTDDLLRAAAPWLGGAEIIDAGLQRWRYATPVEPHPETCLVRADGGLVFAGDGYGGPRVEGAFLSGRAAAEAVLNRSV